MSSEAYLDHKRQIETDEALRDLAEEARVEAGLCAVAHCGDERHPAWSRCPKHVHADQCDGAGLCVLGDPRDCPEAA